MKVWVHRVIAAGGLGAAVAGWGAPASASGFAAAHFGGEHGNVTETNGRSLYYNPGAIGFGTDNDIIGDGELAIRHATWNHPAEPPNPNDQTLPAGNDFGNAGLATLTNVFGGPALAGYHKFGNLAVGGGLFVPFGGKVNWDQDQNASNMNFPRAIDGVQRWHIINASLEFIYTTIGVAYKLGPLSVGVSGNVIIESVSTSQAHNLSNNNDSTSEGRASLDVSGINGSIGAGAMFEALPERLWLAASYQAQPGMIGRSFLTGTLKYENPGSMPVNYNVDFHENLPDIVRAGVRWRMSDDVELRLFGDLTRWGVMKSQCVNINAYGDDCLIKGQPFGADATKNSSVQANLLRNWNDTYGARLGASYWLNPSLELFAGVGYETAASPDATMEPSTMDGNNLLGSIGGRLKLTEVLYVSASFTSLYFLDRTVTNSQLYQLDPNTEVRFPTQTEDGNGTYTQWIGVLDGNIEAKF
jgi:long-chain fatty acid transport protein